VTVLLREISWHQTTFSNLKKKVCKYEYIQVAYDLTSGQNDISEDQYCLNCEKLKYVLQLNLQLKTLRLLSAGPRFVRACSATDLFILFYKR
jgi:hypothetical protein